jgi:hypothetical protein
MCRSTKVVGGTRGARNRLLWAILWLGACGDGAVQRAAGTRDAETSPTADAARPPATDAATPNVDGEVRPPQADAAPPPDEGAASPPGPDAAPPALDAGPPATDLEPSPGVDVMESDLDDDGVPDADDLCP